MERRLRGRLDHDRWIAQEREVFTRPALRAYTFGERRTVASLDDSLKSDAKTRLEAAGIVIDTLDLETEPITVVLEAAAYRETLHRAW